MLFSVQQCDNINMRGFLIINTNNLACIVRYFVMATVSYLLYMPTRLYLNTVYTVSSTKNGLKNYQLVITNDNNRCIATNGLTIINVGTDNICLQEFIIERERRVSNAVLAV